MQLSDVDYLDTWKALEEGVTSKLVRSIGVSNFNEEQLERVLAEAKVPICVNQVSRATPRVAGCGALWWG